MRGLQTRAYNLGEVRTVLSDGMPASRNTLRSIIYDFGFREIALLNSVVGVAEHLDATPVDLLICDTDLPDGDICDVIHKVRHGECGTDPFLPVISVTWEPTPDVVQKVVRSGADILLTLPVSNELLAEAMERLIRKRKPFVVTSEYIGPDRRGKPRSDEWQTPLVEVPNPLRSRATGVSDDHLYERSLEKINDQKIERHAQQISYLVKVIVDHFTDGPRDRNIVAHLERLTFVAQDMKLRVAGTEYGHQGALCDSVVSVASNIVGSGKQPSDKELQLLTQVSLAFQVAFKTSDQSVEAALDIVRAIAQLPQH